MKQDQSHMDNTNRLDAELSDELLQQICAEAMTPMPDEQETQKAWEEFERQHPTATDTRRAVPLCKRVTLWTIASLSASAFIIAAWLITPRKMPMEPSDTICYYEATDTPNRVEQATKGGWCTLHTPPATTTTITLDDETVVTLGASSTLTYPVSMERARKREVKLEGEAFFKVAHNKHKPFTVTTGNMKTTVLGTTFVINAYHELSPTVSLIEGKVRIDNGQTTVDIAPGQSGTLASNKIVIDKIDTATTTNWMSDSFDMDNATLQEVMEAIGAWYNKTVVAHANKHTDKRIHFRFSRKASLEEVIGALNEMRTATIKVENDKIVIY